jgi:hypothetical protein
LNLLVLDPRALTAAQRRQLVRAYDALAASELAPIPELNRDAVRAEIDARIFTVLGYADHSAILRQLAEVEPLFSGRLIPV